MMIFFLDPSGKKVYARYGQRTGASADELQSLEGLEFTMQSVLKMHASDQPAFAPRAKEEPRFVYDIKGARAKGCFHCHNVRESMNRELKLAGKWTNDQAWHFPLPRNVGLDLEVDRGSFVESVRSKSSADTAGLTKGDMLVSVGAIPVHSIADVQYALEHAPQKGEIGLAWRKGGPSGELTKGILALEQGWRRTDMSWRASARNMVVSLSMAGDDLTSTERKKYGLTTSQMAFRLYDPVGSRAKAAGFLAGDIVLGVKDRPLEKMNSSNFFYWLQRNYIIGDEATFEIIRGGERKTMNVQMR